MTHSKWAAALILAILLPVAVCSQPLGFTGPGLVYFVVWTVLAAVLIHVSTLVARIDSPSIPKAFVCAVLMMVAPTALAFLNLPFISGAIAGILNFVLTLAISIIVLLAMYSLSTEKAVIVYVIYWVLRQVLSAAITPFLLGMGSGP